MSSSGPVFQNSVYVGINLENILYGVELVLYSRTMYVLLSHQVQNKRMAAFYAIFSTVMLLMVTIWVSTQAVFGEKMWLEDANYSGGPDAFWAKYNSIWYMDFGTTAVVVLQLMTDGLMMYRCWLIWGSYRMIITAGIVWLGTLVLGILVIWTTSVPGGNFFTGIADDFALSYYCVSVGLTATLTFAICYQMLTHGRMVQEKLGQAYASVYFALLSVIIESVLPYTLCGIAFVVSLGVGSGTSIAFASVYLMMMMLILRMASGLAWSDDTLRTVRPSTLKFNAGVEVTTESVV